MGYPRLIYLLEQIILQGKDQITRDFGELAYAQSNRNLPIKFAEKLVEIVTSKILEKAKKILARQGIIINNQILVTSANNDYLVISILPEKNNLLRSIPFISCSIMSAKLNDQLEPINIAAAAIYNPLTGQFYWSDEEKRARENFRKIMTSQVTNINTANNIQLSSANLELCWLASGKIDYANIKFQHYLDVAAADFIAKKAGAISVVDHKENYIKIAANQELFSCLK